MSTTRPDKILRRLAGLAEARREEGSALVVSLVILVAVAIIGMIALQTSTHEIRIAASDRRSKQAFYGADGAAELATEILEQNIESDVGFPLGPYGGLGLIEILNGSFYLNGDDVATTPSDANRDFCLPAAAVANPAQPHTNVKLGGHPITATGAAIQMVAGYEGKGKSAAAGGSNYIYDVNVQRIGEGGSEAIVRIQWRHVN